MFDELCIYFPLLELDLLKIGYDAESTRMFWTKAIFLSQSCTYFLVWVKVDLINNTGVGGSSNLTIN